MLPPSSDEEPEEPSLFDAADREGLPPARPHAPPHRPVERRPAEASSQVAQSLTQALGDFGVQASIVGQIVGPRVTRYELQLAPGTKMSKVSALKDDLSYALATTEIRSSRRSRASRRSASRCRT